MFEMRGEDSPRLPEHLVSAFDGPLPSTSKKGGGLSLDTTNELGDINEADMFESTPSTPMKSPAVCFEV